jgi:hypothetical protein
MHWKIHGGVSCLFAISCICAAAADYEVAQRNPQANDDAAGTADHPWRTLGKAAATVHAGDRVLIRDGIYRESVVVKASGTATAPIIFEAAPGAQVVISGADHLTSWQKDGDGRAIYRTPWSHRFLGGKYMTHPDDEYHRLIGRCEQVVDDGFLLRQVLAEEQLAPGAFFVDLTNQALKVWDPGSRDLNHVMVEASVRPELFRVEGEYVELRALHFRYAANMAQHGAVVLAGSHNVLQDCVLESMNSSGATFVGEHQVVRRCVFRNNGQLGFGANGAHDLLFTDSLVENNNAKDFDRGWEAGGDKLVLCRGAVLERSRFVRNHGSGVWFDIGNEHCVVRQCLIADNEDAGIFDEISFGLQARDNVIVGNGFAATAGAWGAQAGISLSSSPDSVIERNLILGNREGFNFREQTRTTPRIGVAGAAEEPVWNHDQTIRRNVIALNRDAQIWGWFDMPDGRHWPAGSQTPPAAATGNSAKPGDIADPYTAKSRAGQPVGLTLEKLRLSFVDNCYFAGPGQGWFVWGVSWSRHQAYASLADFQQGLGIDHGGRELDPTFSNLPALDCRVSADTLASLRSCYPEGPVPGVQLGLKP